MNSGPDSERAQSDARARLYDAVARILDLRECTRHDPKELKNLFAQERIKLTRATENPFTPLVKLVLGKSQKGATISRYARVLRRADSQGKTADELAEFIEQEGGIVECARKDRLENHAEKEPSTALTNSRLAEIRVKAPRVSIPEIGTTTPGAITSLLVEALEDGSFRILGMRPAKETAISRYKPVGEDSRPAEAE